jgi:hypothetical protein
MTEVGFEQDFDSQTPNGCRVIFRRANLETALEERKQFVLLVLDERWIILCEFLNRAGTAFESHCWHAELVQNDQLQLQKIPVTLAPVYGF